MTKRTNRAESSFGLRHSSFIRGFALSEFGLPGSIIMRTMRTWLLTLAALPFVCLFVLLIVVVFWQQDLNIAMKNHRSMHLHADSQVGELIWSRQITSAGESVH